jgi:hypothetical protein
MGVLFQMSIQIRAGARSEGNRANRSRILSRHLVSGVLAFAVESAMLLQQASYVHLLSVCACPVRFPTPGLLRIFAHIAAFEQEQP